MPKPSRVQSQKKFKDKKKDPTRNKTLDQYRQAQRQKSPFVRRQTNALRKKNPGEKVLREIRHYQKTTNNIVPKQPFCRVLREVCLDVCDGDYKLRWTNDALTIIQSACQDYMVGLFQDSYLCAMHSNRMTLMAKDFRLARRIRGLNDPGNR